MTFNVYYYTDRAQPDSEFIDRVWYDNSTGRLALELHGVVYEYGNVSYSTYSDLVNADSPGTYYRNNLRGTGQAVRLGPVSELVQVQKSGPQPVGGYVYSDGSAFFPTVKAEEFVIKAQDVVPGSLMELPKFPLAQPVKEAKNTFAYTLQFVLADGNVEQKDERSHTLEAKDLDDAIEQMFVLAELLGQSIVLKGASVRFD